jgi:hypothetical protein
MWIDVRRLAALDMRGTGSGRWRPSIVLAEFVVGVLACGGLGLVLVAAGGSGLLIGVWLLGAGVNYVPLAAHALDLRRPGRLAAELAGVDVRSELMRYGLRQLWIAVPGVVAIAAVLALRGPRSGV